MLTTKQKFAKYGQPGPTNLVMIDLPFPLRIAWDKKVTVKRMQVHKLIAVRLKKVYTELLAHYGLAEIQRLEIDLFGGSYNYRVQRGGTNWSSHAWAIAVDHSPEKNSLKMTAKTAQFAKPEYKLMMDIFYKNGFVNQGIEKGFDFMHFESKD